jgi:hypothetical protein
LILEPHKIARLAAPVCSSTRKELCRPRALQSVFPAAVVNPRSRSTPKPAVPRRVDLRVPITREFLCTSSPWSATILDHSTMAGLVRSGPEDSSSVQSSTPASIAFKDNSNPQQGSMIGAAPSGHTRTADPLGSRATVPMASATAQGGRPSLKIPPHRKDARKLFVGGLPVDSK